MNETMPRVFQSCDEFSYLHALDNHERIAIDSPSGVLTYGQLERRVSLLAETLLETGCRPGDRLALLLAHGPATIIAMLAALRANLVYVPLDIAWPISRQREIIKEADAGLVLMERGAPRLASPTAGRILRHDFSRAHEAVAKFRPHAGSQPAYILFTSGSTGKPKGIVQSRLAMANHAAHYAKSIALHPDERISLLAQYTCDAAVMDVFGALHAGARLCLFDPRGENVAKLIRWLARTGIAVCHLTPTLYRAAFRPRQGLVQLPALRCVVLGGESVFEHDVRHHFTMFPQGVELINGYGPTECTLALQQKVLPSTALHGDRVPVGSPVAGISVSLRDHEGQAVQEGSIGEIVLLGQNVALGYWPLGHANQRGFSAANKDEQRSFATGDLGLQRSDGSYIHLGRADDQLKVAGLRVEPGEIEARVLQIPGIVLAAVVATKSGTGQRLACCYVPAHTAGPSEETVKQMLRDSLPAYMVPSIISSMSALPLLTSGKIDRQALLGAIDAVSAPAPPEASLEEVVACAWSKILGGNGPSRTANFFALGGDSLQAFQIELEIEARLLLPCPSLFHFPTIEQMALALLNSGAKSGNSRPVSASGDMAPLAPPQRRYWARCQHPDQGTAFHLGIIIDIAYPLDVALFMQAFNSVVLDNDVFQLKIEQLAGEPRLVRCAAGMPGLHMQMSPPGPPGMAWRSYVDTVAHEQLNAPFMLDQPGLFRARLLTRDANTHALVLVFHHLIMDGWARRIMERELAMAYERLAADSGASERLRRPRYLDANFPSVQEDILSRASKLAHAFQPSGSALPYDAAGETQGAAELKGKLPPRVFAALNLYARGSGVSLFAVLASIFGLALAWWRGSGNAVATIDRLNRDAGSRDVIGLFADVAPLAFEYEAGQEFASFARTTQHNLADMNMAGYPSFVDLMGYFREGELCRYDKVFPVALAIESNHKPSDAAFRLGMTSREVAGASVSRDLIFVFSKGAEDCELSLLYRRARFRQSTAARLMRAVEAIARTLAHSTQPSIPPLSCGDLLESCKVL